MSFTQRFVIFLGLVAVTILLPILVCIILVSADLAPLILPLFLLIGLVYAWMFFAYSHYHQGRQEEFQELVTTAVESQAPLAPALRAYVLDRPRGIIRNLSTGLFLFVPGYFWPWHRHHDYDRKVEHVADQLEAGVSLPEALQANPGVAAPEMVLAVAIGESTGQLATCLRRSGRGRLTTVWLEILPRLIYPLVLLIFVSSIIGFWTIYLAPKIQRIYQDSGVELPHLTRRLIHFGDLVFSGDWTVLLPFILGLLAIVGLGSLLLFSSGLRWRLPGLGRLYRMNAQSRTLKMLAILLETGKPVPEALAILSRSGYFARAVQTRLDRARQVVEQGTPLADSLRQGELLPAGMVPLVQTAERVRNLPWALAELGEDLGNRTVRLMKRISLVVFPASVVAVGVVVGFVVIGMYLPLVELIGRLSE